MTQRIIFLDIDGPVIPISCYYLNRMCSFDREPISTIACGELIRLCELTGAKIVFNTTHNRFPEKLVEAMAPIAAHIHERPHTLYPDIPRDLAVKEWLNGEDWIAFDDAQFTDDQRLIWIDPRIGITADHVDKALEFWGVEDKAVFLL